MNRIRQFLFRLGGICGVSELTLGGPVVPTFDTTQAASARHRSARAA